MASNSITLAQVLAKPRKALFFILTYRIHISAIFSFLLFYNNYRLGVAMNYPLLISFSLWHFALYLFDRVYDGDLDKQSQPEEYVPENQRKFLYGLTVALVLGSLGFYIQTGFNLVYWFILLPITFLYTYPVYGKVRIKNLFIIKNLYSALPIWAMPLLFQAFLLLGSYDVPDNIMYSIISLAIYIWIGEIYWDIRDTSVDKKYGIATIPNTWGLLVAKILIVAMIVADWLLYGFNVNGSGIIYLILLPFTRESSDRIIFHLPPLIALTRFIIG